MYNIGRKDDVYFIRYDDGDRQEMSAAEVWKGIGVFYHQMRNKVIVKKQRVSRSRNSSGSIKTKNA